MSYIFNADTMISMPRKAENAVVSELLSNFTYGGKWEICFGGVENEITVGKAEKAERGSAEYVVNITDSGIYIGGADFPSTMRGFIAFLETIRYDEKNGRFYAENACLKGNPKLNFRCVHICIFPETDLVSLKKYVRSCAFARFTHIIFEFWGTLRLDCMSELAWTNAYSKDEIRAIVAEANALGMEIIPMFNHIGHASACREICGKHVVLDQNPRLEYLFDSYGWIWNISRSDVRELHKRIRKELIDICGEGKYFHLGCDEAYKCGYDTEKAAEMCEYLNEISKELSECGRRPIIWHDMLISSEEFKGYTAASTKEISHMLLSELDKSFVIADWQYDVKNELWKSSKMFKENGFDVVCCPWDNPQNIAEAVNTANSEKMFGIIHTTWHTLEGGGFREMIFAGRIAYDAEPDLNGDIRRFYCAQVARKVMPSNGEYLKSGWTKEMISPQLW